MVIVGGGKVGSFLARELERAGHVVAVIEANPERAAEASETSRVLVFEGDGTDMKLLQAADADRADWTLAVTGRDEDNLVACQLARAMGSKHVLARLNNPRNRPTFDALDVPVVGVTDLMARVISREVEVADLSRIALIAGGGVSLVELVVPEGFSELAVADLGLPPSSILVTVVRDGRVSVPGAATVLHGGDRVVAVTLVENEAALRGVFDFAVEDDDR